MSNDLARGIHITAFGVQRGHGGGISPILSITHNGKEIDHPDPSEYWLDQYLHWVRIYIIKYCETHSEIEYLSIRFRLPEDILDGDALYTQDHLLIYRELPAESKEFIRRELVDYSYKYFGS